MKLKEEINQKHFSSHGEECLVNLVFTYNWFKGVMKDYLKPYGLTMQQYNVMRILNGAYPKPITTSVIRKRMLDKMSDASRIVERLHNKQLVERSTCKEDKRLVDVVITEAGRKLVKQVLREYDSLLKIASNLTEDEARTLSQLLDKLRD